jgi:hypothetical protein
MSLVHDSQFFSRDWILARSREHDFPNPLAVEMFIWDCEIAAQFQKADTRVILKGGAAAQLLLPVGQQRGSVDIDTTVTETIAESEISRVVAVVKEAVPSLSFRLHKPRRPKTRLPLVTYFIDAPTTLGLELTRRKQLEIKADFLLDDARLPTLEVHNVETFALQVKRMKIPTLGTSIGDKLLTLAKGSIGMTREEDYPKQMYDIDLLSRKISEPTFSEIVDAVRKLTPLEASYRGLEIEPSDALRDVHKLGASFGTIDTTIGGADDKRHIEAFQQFFISRSQRLPFYEWASRALRMAFMAALVNMALTRETNSAGAARTLAEAQGLAESLGTLQAQKIRHVREGLLKMVHKRIRYFKELKGKPLTRVFWEVATPHNLNDVANLLA